MLLPCCVYLAVLSTYFTLENFQMDLAHMDLVCVCVCQGENDHVTIVVSYLSNSRDCRPYQKGVVYPAEYMDSLWQPCAFASGTVPHGVEPFAGQILTTLCLILGFRKLLVVCSS